jgi:TetR/AcrR family transcriptional regulator, transcriptional repressor for nem operon
MRVSRAEARRNRRRILEAAARLFRERGIESSGVDAITERAGLTHGAFYSQFESKEAVVAEAVLLALRSSGRVIRETAEQSDGTNGFARFVDAYLARTHRDAPGEGCVVAALAADIARQPKRVRDAFTKGLKESLALLAELTPPKASSDRYDDAIAAFACLAGAVILSRAVDDEPLSRRILKAAAKQLNRPTTRGSIMDRGVRRRRA